MADFDFEKVVTQGLSAGRERLGQRDEIVGFMRKFADTIETSLSSECNDKIHVRMAPPLSLKNCIGNFLTACPQPLATSFEISAMVDENAAPVDWVPIFRYDLDQSRCYPCYVQWGSKDVACHDLKTIQSAVTKAWTEQSMGTIGRLKELHKKKVRQKG